MRHTIEYDGILFVRYPDAASRHQRVYYWPHDPDTGKRRYDRDALHRELWRAAHGDIPPGCIIHHIDGDPLNNAIDNLECVTRAEHAERHAGEGDDNRRANLERIRPLASAWHGSKDGRRFHRWLGKHAWENRKPEHKGKCESCGIEFEAYHATARFCTRTCLYRASEKRRRRNVGTCAACGAEFSVRPNSPQKFCSVACRIADRRPTPRTCVGCGTEFVARKTTQLACSRKCAWAARKKG